MDALGALVVTSAKKANRSRTVVNLWIAFGMVLLTCAFWCSPPLGAATGGGISGTVKDQSDALVPGAALRARQPRPHDQLPSHDGRARILFLPTVPVGRYELTIEAAGFKTQKKTGIVVDADAAIRVDISLEVGERNESVTVSAVAAQAQVETGRDASGRSGPGGANYCPALEWPQLHRFAGNSTRRQPRFDADSHLRNHGRRYRHDQSLRRSESRGCFYQRPARVRQRLHGERHGRPGTHERRNVRNSEPRFDSGVPRSHQQFRSGIRKLQRRHGKRGHEIGERSLPRQRVRSSCGIRPRTRRITSPIRAASPGQNQFGGTIGGPIRRQKIFFFADYQGTRTVQGITSPLISVPSLADRMGNLADLESELIGKVSGPALATLLSSRLGYAVSQGESYFTPGCTSATCVLPSGLIPMTAWSAPATQLLQYIPKPDQSGNLFSTSAFGETVRDDKAAGRMDANTAWGQFSGYYFLDNYRLDNPYPGAQGGASVPGFDALTLGQAQLFTVGYTKILGANTVNEFHASLIRNANNIGKPHGGLGVSLSSQGFQTGAGTTGITVQAPQLEGVENIVFPSFIMGVPITNVDQWNNTLYLGDSLSKVVGSHTLKFGGQFHIDQVNEHPNATFNGTFSILGTETGSAFADFLLGVPSNFTQSTGQPFYLRNRYVGAFLEDSWRARSDLTLNLGLRWDLIMPWWEKDNNLQTVVPGEQSVLFPNAIPGLVVPGDPGIPSERSRQRNYHNFAPRIGLAYSPKFTQGILGAIFGGPGKSSIRASYGIFYTAFPGLSAGIMYAVPPFGYNYLSPAPPLFATPFVNAGDGAINHNPFPITFPPNTVSAKHPYAAFDWAAVTPDSADPYFYHRDGVALRRGLHALVTAPDYSQHRSDHELRR